ncbi:MAG: peroxidase, partial [Actinobacteria bacterium]|nr:peroxidase [Actinomycetota bacterium]
AVCAAFNLFNRIVEGHGIASHESDVQDAKMINTHGYDRRR